VRCTSCLLERERRAGSSSISEKLDRSLGASDPARVPSPLSSEAERDQRLVAACNRGDERAFEELYGCYRDWVFRLARRLSGSHEDALDVLQETFAYLISKFPGLELRARMTTLLYPVINNLAASARTRSRRVELDEEAVRAAGARAEGQDDEQREHLAGCLAALAPDKREVLLMRFVDGMSQEEIAAALEIPLGTVKSRMHNALTELREDERTREYFE